MELAWPRLANEETAIATVIDKDSRTNVAATSAIDREQIFRCMTRFPRKLIGTGQCPGRQRLFNGVMRFYAVYG
jgi:hypothetical protein